VSPIREVGGDLGAALSSVSVPTYVIDRDGIIRWVNPAAERLFGECRGRRFTSVVAPEDLRRARDHFARKMIGTEHTSDGELIVLNPSGGRVKVDISSVALTEGHHVVGVFGQISDVAAPVVPPPLPALTPRQAEVLRLLEHGRSTDDIARELHLSPETVRNHVRRMLRALGVHTRLEAVAHAHRARAVVDVTRPAQAS
jgi:PAS domain S-box-containing protein